MGLKIRKIIHSYILHFIGLSLGGFLLFLELSNKAQELPLWLVAALILVFTMVSFIDKIHSNRDNESLQITLDDFKKTSQESSEETKK